MLKHLLSGAAVFVATFQFAYSVNAETTHNFATSKKLGVSVDFEIKNGDWCQEKLSMILKAQKTDFFEGLGFQNFLPKVGKLVQRECPKATSFEILGTDSLGSKALFAGSANASDGWKPVKGVSTQAVNKTLPEPPSITVSLPKEIININPAEIWEKAVPLESPDVFYKYVGDNLELTQDEQFIRRYAEQSDCDNYRVKVKDEFAIADYLKSVEGKLLQKIKKGPLYVFSFHEHEIGKYNFETKSFPVELGSRFLRKVNTSYWCRFNGDYLKFPLFYIQENTPDPIFKNLPIEETLASNIVKRQRDARKVFAEYLFKVDRISYKKKTIGYGYYAKTYGWQSKAPDGAFMDGELLAVRVYADEKKKKLLHTFTSEDVSAAIVARKQEIEEMRLAELKDEQEKQEKETMARKERDRALIERNADKDREQLQYAPYKQKLAYLFKKGSYMTDLSEATASSIILNQDVTINSLVQIKSVKDAQAIANWPVEMTLDLSKSGLTGVKPDDWLLVSGDLSADNKASNDAHKIIQDIKVNVSQGRFCEKPRCAEAENIDYLISNAYPSLKETPKEAN